MRNQCFNFFALFCMSTNAFAKWKSSASVEDLTITSFNNCKELKEYIEDEIIAANQNRVRGVNLSKLGLGAGKTLSTAGSGGSVNSFGSGAAGGFGGAGDAGSVQATLQKLTIKLLALRKQI